MKKRIRDISVFSLAGGLLYLNVLDAPFVVDDHTYVVKNWMVRNGGPFLSYFNQGFCEGALQGFECPYYRPIVTLLYRLDYLIWGLNPFGFHLSNLLIHMGVIGLFYVVLRVMFPDPLVARVATVLFAVHPVHSESVAAVYARTDPPAAFFFLLSLLGFHFFLNKHRRSGYFYVLSVIGFAMALLTKEIAFVLPLLLVVYDLLWFRPWKGINDFLGRWPDYLPFAAIGSAYLGIRFQVLGGVGGEVLRVSPLWERLLGVPVLIQEYFTLLIYPYPLILFHEVPDISGPGDPVFLYSLGLLVFLGAGLIWVWKKYPGIAFGGIWFLATLFPVLNVVPIPAPAVMERAAYLPSIGFCISIGAFAFVFLRWVNAKGREGVRKGVLAAAVSVVLVFSIMTLDRNRVWNDEVLLWEDVYAKLSPEFPVGHFNLGQAYYERGDYQKAALEFERALKYRPASGVYHALGLVYQKLERNAEAIDAYGKAIEWGTKNPQVFYNLGVLLYHRGNREEVVPLLQTAVRLNPNFLKAHLSLGKIYMDRNEVDQAISAFREAVRIRPEDYLTHFDLGVLFDRKGSFLEAARHYSDFLQASRGTQVPQEMVSHAMQRLHAIRGD